MISKVGKVRKEYQEKLDKLQNEVKKLQAAKKEHAKLLKSQGQYEKQLTKLKTDVLDMKRTKVKLVQKMKEESNRHRELEIKKNREVAQLKKESRKHETKIKSMETERRIKDTVLKRKQEEVVSLRRNARKVSNLAAKGKNAKLAQKTVKSKWQNIEKKITKVALNKQAVSQMENDMDRWLKDRQKLSQRLDKLSTKRRRLLEEKGEISLLEDLDDQVENVRANINYLHDNIVDCQQNIVQMEQANEAEEDAEDEVAKILDVGELGLEEARYLLGKMLNMTVHQTCMATQKEGKIKELDNRMQQAMKQNSLHQQLLQHMIEQQDLEIYDLMLQNEDGEGDDSDSDSEQLISSARRPPTLPLAPPASLGHDPMLTSLRVEEDAGTGSDSSLGRREKARRKNLNKEDLLFNDMDMPGLSTDMLMLPPKVGARAALGGLPANQGMPPVPGSRLPRQVSNLSKSHAQPSANVPFSR